MLGRPCGLCALVHALVAGITEGRLVLPVQERASDSRGNRCPLMELTVLQVNPSENWVTNIQTRLA